ncbi:MAG TPA: exodeoxyribonuclease III [Caulobacteraceae bacterium]|nr:exodeoxyribonuclease III [Caulobacteraceae bacterium]
MGVRIASWNINSARLRAEQAARLVAERGIDVLCLQEIKCREAEFPAQALADVGLRHLRICAQKGWHGVAIASRLPLQDTPALALCREGHARNVSARVAGIEVHNLYVPAGGDVPDCSANPKFAHKLDFLGRLAREMGRRDPGEAVVLAGDLNVAPGEHDVWNHRFMSKVVSHTPVEIDALVAVRDSLGFIDLAREARPAPEKLFTWWSYRALDFRLSNRGLRLDHLWVTPAIRQAANIDAVRIHDDVRSWVRPSDHAPVSIDLDL